MPSLSDPFSVAHPPPTITDTFQTFRTPGGSPKHAFVMQGNVCALLAAKHHVNVFLYDGAIVTDPESIITSGHENKTARTVAIRQGETINADALTAMFRAIVLAGVLVLADPAPALPVLAVAALAALAELLRRRTHARVLIRAVGPASLAGLLLLAVAVGALAREWTGPARLLAHATATGTTAIAAGTSVLLNNLPAAALLGAHPYHLLAGLNLGPNLAATGSLSSLIWLRSDIFAPRDRGGTIPSAVRYSADHPLRPDRSASLAAHDGDR